MIRYPDGLKRGAIIIGLTVVLVVVIRTFIIAPCYIPSNGMENILWRGDYVLLSKLFESHPRRNNIVVYKDPNTTDAPFYQSRAWFVGTCAGLPGDTLRLNYRTIDALASVRRHPDYKQFYRSQSNKVHTLSRYEVYLMQQRDTSLKYNSMRYPAREYLFILPKRGQEINIDSTNCRFYARMINLNESHHAIVKGNALWVDKQEVNSWTFKDNYYWMSSNNVLDLKDSRTFGPVAGANLVGRVQCVLFSKDKKKGYFAFRPDRFFKKID